METVRDVVGKMDGLWRRLAKNTPPKVHAWQHFVLDLERFRGLKQHHESKIEVSHQVGRKTDLRFRAMAGNINKRIQAASKYQANLRDPAMLARQAEIQQQRSRKLGSKAKAAKEMKIVEQKRCKQAHRDAVLDLPEITEDFPSVLQLTIVDRERAKQEATSVGTSG